MRPAPALPPGRSTTPTPSGVPASFRSAQSTQVARIPFGYQLRSVDDGPFGLKLKFPVSLGVHDLEVRDRLGRGVKENVETVALAIGVELEFPVRDSWRLKPYAEVGYGRRIDGDEEALLYRGGVKSLWLLSRERLDIRIGAALEFEGFELLEGTVRDSYGVAEVGCELRWPGGFQVRGSPSDFGAYLIARRFLPEVDVVPLPAESLGIGNQMEIGLTFGTSPSLIIWGLDAPRPGLAYRWGDGLSAYRLNFGFPF
jgi:hypothetical protein